MPGTTFPPLVPTVNGITGEITVDQMLKQPTRVTRRVANLLAQRLLAERIFSTGAPAVGGAVIYDRVLASDLYTTRDVQEITPGSEFPIVDDEEVTPSVAAVAKRGGAALVTYESVRRNQWDVVNRKMTRLANTVARKTDTVAMAVLAADPAVTSVVGTNWNNATSGDPVNDVMSLVSAISNLDLGYEADTVLINPAQELALFRLKSVRDSLPRENAATNPLLSGRINGLLSLQWYVSNRVPAGTAYVLQAGAPGSLHDEVPFYTRTIDRQHNETWLLQAARVTVPVITDPKSVIRLTGLAA